MSEEVDVSTGLPASGEAGGGPSSRPRLMISTARISDLPSYSRLPLYIFMRAFSDYESLVFTDASRQTFEAARVRLQNVIDKFEADHGEICDIYVTHRGASILVEKKIDADPKYGEKKPRVQRSLFVDINSDSELANSLIFRCRNIADDAISAFGARRALKHLRESTLLIAQAATLVIYAEESFRTRNDEAERATLLRSARGEVDRAEARVMTAIKRRARFRYLGGAFLGLIVPVLVANVLLFTRSLNPEFGAPAVQTALIFGAIGAVASVYQRLSAEALAIDFTATRTQVYILGALKPIVGAVFAVVIHFIIFEGVLQGIAIDTASARGLGLFVIVAFISGFSERFASDMLDRTESSLSATSSPTSTAKE